MKKLILFGAFALLSILEINAQNLPSYVPSDGLVGYWPFDGNANDVSGNGHDATITGASLTEDLIGDANKAYYFDGDDRMTISHHADFNVSNLTFFVSYRTYEHANAIPNGNQVFFSKRESSGWGSSFEFSPDIAEFAFGYSNSINGNFSSGSGDSDYGVWRTVCYTHNNNWIKVYIDGVLVDEIQSPGQFSNNNLDITIGMRGNGWHGFRGEISTIGFWNRALSESEVQDLFSGDCDIEVPVIDSNNNLEFCSGDSVELSVNENINYTYQWYRNDNEIQGATSTEYVVKESGSYSLMAYEEGCYEESESVSVTVNEIPDVVIEGVGQMYYSSDEPVTLIGTPTGGVFFGEGVSGTMFSPSETSLGTTNIQYTYTDDNNCFNDYFVSTIVVDTLGTACSSTDTLIMDIEVTGFGVDLELNVISIYPNPAQDYIMIENSNYAAMGGYELRIMNSLGQIVFQSSFDDMIMQISASEIGAEGTYYIQVWNSTNQMIESKVLILN